MVVGAWEGMVVVGKRVVVAWLGGLVVLLPTCVHGGVSDG